MFAVEYLWYHTTPYPGRSPICWCTWFQNYNLSAWTIRPLWCFSAAWYCKTNPLWTSCQEESSIIQTCNFLFSNYCANRKTWTHLKLCCFNHSSIKQNLRGILVFCKWVWIIPLFLAFETCYCRRWMCWRNQKFKFKISNLELGLDGSYERSSNSKM